LQCHQLPDQLDAWRTITGFRRVDDELVDKCASGLQGFRVVAAMQGLGQLLRASGVGLRNTWVEGWHVRHGGLWVIPHLSGAREPLRVKQRLSFNVDCNWKCVQGNFAESYHAKFLHTETIDRVIDSKASALQLIEGGHDAIAIKSRTVLPSGMGAAFFRRNTEETAEQTESVLAEVSRSAQRSYNVFPNCTVPVAETMFPIITLWPESVGVTRVEVLFVKNCAPSQDDAETDQATLTFFEAVIKEELAALAGMHQALSHGGIQSIPLCYAEQFIYHHNQNVDRVIGAANIPAAMRVQHVDLPIARAT
jgi:hypothetical protein